MSEIEKILTKLASMTPLEKDDFLHQGLKENYQLRLAVQAEQDLVDKLRSIIAVYEEALKVYADKDNWCCSEIANITGGYDSLYYGDYAYKIAHEALELGKK